jgi:hypothetical protein
VKHSARKVDTDPNVALLAIARMTARAITWAIVSVNADGLVNCARIVVRQVIYYNYNLYCKSFPYYLFIFVWEGFYGKKCRQPCPPCVNGKLVTTSFRQLVIFRYLSILFFFEIFISKVTVNVIRWTVVVLVSPVTWEYDARNHALKVFNYFDLFDGSIETFNILHSLSLCVCLSGTYGDGCQQKCNRCKNGAECHHVTG